MLNITTESLQPQPMRTGAEQFRMAGLHTCLLAVEASTGHHYVNGKGGPAVLVREEWAAYERFCNQYSAVPVDVPQAEDPFAAIVDEPLTDEELWHIVSALKARSKEVEECVRGSLQTLSLDEANEALGEALKELTGISACLRELDVRLERRAKVEGGLSA